MNTAASTAEFWTQAYNAFDPFRPISPERIKDWFVERPDTPLSVILTHFQPMYLPNRLILVGHASSGKSSELARLGFDLAQPEYGYFAINVDLSRNLNVDRVNQVEVLFLLGAAVFKLAEEAKLKPDRQRFDVLVESLHTLVRTHTNNKTFEINVAGLLRGLVCFGAGMLGGAAGAPVAVGLTEAMRDFNFISGTDTEVVRKLEVEPKISEILVHLNALLDDVKMKAGRSLVLLVDGLDRVRSAELAEMLFVRNPFLAEVNCRVLYAVPTYMYYQPQFAPVRQAFQPIPFPNVRLRHREHAEERDEAGYAAMREVVHARLRYLNYTPEQIIAPDALDELVSASGGLMRDLIRLMRDACVEAVIAGVRRIEHEAAQKVVAALRRQYEAQLTPKYQAVLDEVRQTQRRTESPECDLLLLGNFILSYSNRQIWYDVHSILW